MKKFKFRLETVERHRKIKEQESRVALSRGLAALREIENNLFAVDKEEVKARREFAAMGNAAGNINTNGFWVLDNFIEGQKIRRKELKQQLNEQEKKVNEIYKKFLSARQQRKSIETLREKHETEYRAGFRKYENRQQDSLYTMREKIRQESVDTLKHGD